MGASCLCLYLLCSMPLVHGTQFRIHFFYAIFIMEERKMIYLCLAHLSEEGAEQKYVKEAFDTNWVVLWDRM